MRGVTINCQLSTINYQLSTVFPHINPPTPAARMHQVGDTPKAEINTAVTTGIHQLNLFSFAFFAMPKQGARISATTQGRTPMNIFST